MEMTSACRNTGRGAQALCLVVLAWLGVTVAAHAVQPARIVVEFSESVAHPEEPEYINELSDYVGLPLSYLKAMPGGAHVLGVSRITNADQLERVLRQLSRRDEVVSATKEHPAEHSFSSNKGGG